MTVTFAQFHVGQTFETLREVDDAIKFIDEAHRVRPTRPTTVEGWQVVSEVLDWLFMEKARLTPSICEHSCPSMPLECTCTTVIASCTGDEVKGAFLVALKATEAMHASRPDASNGDHV